MRWLQSVLAVVAVLFVSSACYRGPSSFIRRRLRVAAGPLTSGHAAYPDPTVAADPSAPSVGTWVTVDVGPEGRTCR